MSKSRARFLAELLNSSGLVRESRSALAGADGIVDLDNLPTITNAKLENSSISIAGHSTALGGSVSLDTADISEHTDYPYFTNARARSAISVSGSLSYNSTTGVISYTQPTNISTFTNDSGYLTSHQSLAAYSTLASPTFTGTPAAPTATAGTNTTQIATTAFVTTAVDNIVDAAPGTLNTLNELAAALGDDANFSTTVTNSIATKLPLAGGTLTGNVSFGDSNKAIFGAGSDLQIYHDGSNSYIDDAGSGVLFVRGNSQVILGKYTGERMFEGNADGSSYVFYDNSVRLHTTSTGIDVTGSVVSDGLTSSGNILLDGSGNTTVINKTSGAGNNPLYRLQAGTNYWDMIGIFSDADDTFRVRYNDTDALEIANNGDISFYNSAGTSQNLFWDASTSRLGLGTTAPARDLHIVENDDWAQIRLEGNSSGGAEIMMGDSTTESKGRIQYVNASNYMRFDTNATERLRITSAGNVGIGTTSPSFGLSVESDNGSGYAALFRKSSSDPALTIQTTSGITQIQGLNSALNATYGIAMQVSGGNVGIGTASPSNKLDIKGTVGFEATNSTNKWLAYTYTDNSFRLNYNGAGADEVVIDSGGNAIFTKANGAYLQLKDASAVRGSINVTTSDGLVFTTGASFTERMSINSSGAITFNQAYTFPTSDGTSGQVITTDGSGNLSFSTVSGAGASDVVNDTSPQLGGNLDTNGNDILFADNDKAIFGAGSDLQIYHDGSNSFITENGTGYLGIGTNGSKVIINKSPFENMAEFITDGAVNLYHNNVQKFATTSTGIDVTGTVTADGATIDGAVTVNGAGVNLDDAYSLAWGDGSAQVRGSGSSEAIDLRTASTTRLNIDADGDVSLYNSAGTSQDLFWDASESRLGLGTTSPSYVVHASTTNNTIAQFQSTDNRAAILVSDNDTDSYFGSENGSTYISNTGGALSSGQLVINSSGNVGINNSAPDTSLHIGNISATNATGQGQIKLEATSGSIAHDAGLEFVGSSFGSGYGWKLTTIDSSGVHLAFGTRQNATAWSEKMRIDSSGNVGIGTSSPSRPLHVAGIAKADSGFEIGNSYIYEGAPDQVNMRLGSDGPYLEFIDAGSSVAEMGNASGALALTAAGAEKVRITSAGDVGINNTNPSAKFHVSGTARFDHSESQGFRTVVTDNIGDRTFYGHHLDVNISGSDTLTASRPHYGLYLDLDSSATGGDTSNEHRVYGLYSDVRLSADSDLAYGSYSIARSSHTSGQVSTLAGAQNYGFANNSAGKTTNTYGAYNFARSSVTGTGEIDNLYGSMNLVYSYQTSTDTGTVCYGSYNMIQYTSSHNVNANQARAVYAEVQIDSTSNTWTLSNAYVVRAEFDNNASGNRTSNGYLFYGNYSGTTPTNAWGLYITNAAKNSISGNVGIGTTLPSGRVHANGDAYTAFIADGTSGGAFKFFKNGSQHAQIFSDGSGDIVFRNHTDSERLRITSTGINVTGAATVGGNTVWHVGNDGSGSGLDADTLDGIDSARFVYGSGTRKTNYVDPSSDSAMNSGFYDIQSTNTPTATWYSYITMAHNNTANEHGHQIAGSFYSPGDLYNRSYSGTNASFSSWTKIWNAANDGSGSGLDADLLDGVQGSSYLRSDTSDTINGVLTVGGTSVGSEGGEIRFTQGSGASGLSGSEVVFDQAGNSIRFFESAGNTRGAYIDINTCQNGATSKIWHSGNDGSGSGLDADTLDGYHSGETGASVNLRTGSNGYLYLDNWLRTGNSTGLYTADGAYFYRGGAYWVSRGNNAGVSGTQYQTNDGTTRGYVYANNSNEIGFLDNTGNWAVRYTSTGTYLGATQDVRINSSALTAMFESDSQDMVFRQKGSGSITWQFTSSGTNRMQLSSAGSLTCEGNITAYGSLSDIRLKENIKVIPNAVDKVAQLKGITFDYKKTKSSSTGVIAQDLQKVLPEAVYDAENLDDDDEKYLAVNYGVMAGLFVEAIKELKQEINELKAQLKEK